MSGYLLDIVLAAEKSPAEEGRDVILSMLVVGLIFLGVIVLGELVRRVSRRRRH